MIWATDTEGRCTYVSDKLSDLTGRNEHDGLGSGWIDLVHPQDKHVVRDVLAQACAAQEAFSFQYRMRVRGERYMWVLAGAIPSFGPPDRVFLGFLGSLTDVEPDDAMQQAFGQVGNFDPPPPRPLTMPVTAIDITADHLLLARAAAQRGSYVQAVIAIDLALEIVGRQIAKLRLVRGLRPN